MKKILTLISAAAMLAVSCQKENAIGSDNIGNPSAPGTLTASFAQTKVTYSETPALDLQPAWEVGDQIIGFDDAGNTYTLAVSSVSAGTATLSGTVPDGTLHLIYQSGAKAGDISDKTLAIDYTSQKGDKTMPAVMLSDGTVVDGSCDFSFTNAGAIIGISAVNGIPQGANVTKVTISGDNLSAATVALSGSALALTVTQKAVDAISVDCLNLKVTDANGTLSTPVYIAVPAGAQIAKVSAIVTKEPETMTIPSTASDKEGVDYVTIAAKYDGTNLSTMKWAKWDVGANRETEYGWYFPWAGTEGYFRYADTWQSVKATSFEFFYKPASTYIASANDYRYVKTQIFSITSHIFYYDSTPYQTQKNALLATCKYSKYLGTIESSSSKYKDPSANETDVLKTVLDPEDDAACVNWGDTWRMPTKAEFRALYDATKWTWDSSDKGYYVTKSGEILSGDKSNALLFFPASGIGYLYMWSDVEEVGYFWASTIDELTPTGGNDLMVQSEGSISPTNLHARYYGLTVRPISD